MKDWKNQSIALRSVPFNILFTPQNKEEIKGVSKLSNSFNDDKQWKMLLSCCEGACKDHDYCYVKMPGAHNNTLKFNHYGLLSMRTQNPYLKKYPQVMTILMNLIQQK